MKTKKHNTGKPKGTGCYLTPEFYSSQAWNSCKKYARQLFYELHNGLNWDNVKRNKKIRFYTNYKELSCTQVEFCKKYKCSKQTYTDARNKLIEVGLIKITHKGGNGKEDRSKYQIFYLGGSQLPDNTIERWKLYDGDKMNWKKEIPKSKHRIGNKNQFKKGESGRARKKINTLENYTLNGV